MWVDWIEVCCYYCKQLNRISPSTFHSAPPLLLPQIATSSYATAKIIGWSGFVFFPVMTLGRIGLPCCSFNGYGFGGGRWVNRTMSSIIHLQVYGCTARTCIYAGIICFSMSCGQSHQPVWSTGHTVILVRITDLSCPTFRVQTYLILDAHCVTDYEWWKLASVFGPALCLKHVVIAYGFFRSFRRLTFSPVKCGGSVETRFKCWSVF